MESTVQCPDCLSQVLRTELKAHVLNCKKYKSTYLKNIMRSIQFLKPNNAEFIIAQCQIAQQRLNDIITRQYHHLKANEVKQQKSITYINRESQPLTSKQQQQNRQSKFDNFMLDKKQKNQQRQQKEYYKKNQQSERSSIWIKNNSKLTQVSKPQLIIQNKQKEKSFLEEIKDDYNRTFYWQQPQQQAICSKCSKPLNLNDTSTFVYADICLHPICNKCLKQFIEQTTFIKNNGKFKCSIKQCAEEIPLYQLKLMFGNDTIQNLQQTLVKKSMNLVTCVKCKSSFDYIKGKSTDAPKVDTEGKKLDQKYVKLYSQSRFTCANCRTQQCKECQQSPYHVGRTCQQFKINKSLKKCRYCLQPLPLGYTSEQGIRAFDNICENKECVIKSKSACSKMLGCNHPCYGFIKQKKCIQCLSENCAIKHQKQLNGFNQDSYCNICFVEGLGSAPCVKLNCKHIFHLDCLKKRLDIRWFTPRILFNFCLCPLCKVWMQPPQECQIYKQLMNFKILENIIADKAVQRLKYQKQDKDQKIVDPKSVYHNNQQKYAMAIYAYFQCFKCKKPYFGGRKNCAQAMNQQKDDKFDPKQLVCPECCPIQAKNCQKHGKQFINFKCKFCCNVAVWFCWGSTHFCDDCHKKQVAGTYLSKMKKQDLPKCLGPQKCPIGGNHQGNGQTRSLGCGICLNERASIKNF